MNDPTKLRAAIREAIQIIDDARNDPNRSVASAAFIAAEVLHDAIEADPGLPDEITELLRQRFGGLGDRQVADTVRAQPAVLNVDDLDVDMPVVLFDFAIGNPAGAPFPIVSLAYSTAPAVMREVGDLFYQCANVAADRATGSSPAQRLWTPNGQN